MAHTKFLELTAPERALQHIMVRISDVIVLIILLWQCRIKENSRVHRRLMVSDVMSLIWTSLSNPFFKIFRVPSSDIRVLRGAGKVPGCAGQRVLLSPPLICTARLSTARCLYIILSCRQEHSALSLLLQSKCLHFLNLI